MTRRARNAGRGKHSPSPPRDLTGSRGEKVFELAITDYSSFGSALFAPSFLGDKWPAVDYFVQPEESRDLTPFFLAQIKSTTKEQPPDSAYIEISVPRRRVEQLYRLPGPTYLVAVHEPTRRAFIMSIHCVPRSGIYKIPLVNERTPGNLRILYDEVFGFWRTSQKKPEASHFT